MVWCAVSVCVHVHACVYKADVWLSEWGKENLLMGQY